jgi:hypothetical protein
MNSKRNTKRQHYPALGFTLIELLGFIVLVICMCFGAKFIHNRFGGIFGWLLGGFLGFLAFLLVGSALALVKDGFEGIPRLPKCRNGCCRGPGNLLGDYGDYESCKLGDKYYLVCRCGGRYKRNGKRFVVINDDGTETPYLIWRPFRGWFQDTTATK